MSPRKTTQLTALLFSLALFSACSTIKSLSQTALPGADIYPEEEAAEEVYWPTAGAYSEYKSPSALMYYKTTLSPRKWNNIEILNYKPGYFAFPPPCGHRVMHYEGVRGDTRVEVHREIIDGDTYTDVIQRRRGSDHCEFTRTIYYQKQDLDIVEATADCYIWLYGDYIRKYYFVRVGNVVYTFRLLALPTQYASMEPDFDYFVTNTVDNYLLYSPRQQLTPTPARFAAPPSGQKPKKKTTFFSKEELVSFFAPAATQHLISQ